MKPSGIGGQAVMEGVMMKNQNEYAVAVRKPDQQIEIKKDEYVSFAEKYKCFKLPILRGMLAFVESMKIGMSTLTYSASFFEEEEKEPSKVEKRMNKLLGNKAESVFTTITIGISILFAIALFILLPTFLSQMLSNVIENSFLQALLEGAIRIAIFVGYILLISMMNDIKRVFMYHGAEHKTINCIENGYELTVENVRKQTRQHKRCGTSFLLVVMFFSILFFMFIRIDTLWVKSIVRILLVPIIAGVSYEFIRLAGKKDNVFINILSKPGLWLQGLTTREPDDAMIEVAIASVEAVFDWRAFLETETEESVKPMENMIINEILCDNNIDKNQEMKQVQNAAIGKEIIDVTNQSSGEG